MGPISHLTALLPGNEGADRLAKEGKILQLNTNKTYAEAKGL